MKKKTYLVLFNLKKTKEKALTLLIHELELGVTTCSLYS